MAERATLPKEFPVGSEFEIPLWDQRPEEWLKREYAKGRWSFERGYRQNAPREEDRKFGDLTKLLLYGIRVADFFPDGSNPVVVAGFDPAGPKRLGNAMVAAAIHGPSYRRVVLGMDLWRGSGAADASHLMVAFERYRMGLLIVENNGTQDAFLDLITQATAGRLPVQGFTTGQNKMHLEVGIPSLETQVREGMWAICMDDPYDTGLPLSQHPMGCDCAYHTFIEDLNNYPSPGRTNDLLMAWWFVSGAFLGLRQASGQGERTEDEILAEDMGSVPVEELGGTLF